MVFSSPEFLFVFLPLFFLVYHAMKNPVYRNGVVLVFSVAFYAWGEHLYVFLMLFFIAFNYLCALMISRNVSPKVVVAVCLALNIGLIGYYKYADFVIGLVNGALGLSIPLREIPLPLGISFFTFQAMSYVIDVYRRDVPAQRNPLLLGEYITCFPQMMAGPIVRYGSIAGELGQRHASISDVADGARRFIVGLGKKAIIANGMAEICDSIYGADPGLYGFAGAWVAVIAYALQVYYDFSGYSDMAIGLGRIMGFHFPENFNYPYISRSVTEFWRRWHITLGSFFRDYVYIPLGGNRVSKGRWVFNVMAVWALTGLWHGAGMNFVAWGLYTGVLMMVERLWLGKRIARTGAVLPHVYTLLVILIGLVIFRIDSLSGSMEALKAMAFLKGPGSMSFMVTRQIFQMKHLLMFPIGIAMATPIGANLIRRMRCSLSGRIAADVLAFGLLLASVLAVIVSNYNPFIYFRF